MTVGDDLDEGFPGARPRGAVWNVWSRRPFDIVVYDDGLLLLRGRVIDLARRIFTLTPTAWSHGRKSPLENSQELRLVELRATTRAALLAADPDAVLIPTREIAEVRLRSVAGLGWLRVTTAAVGSQSFVWAPTMNYPDTVRDLLRPILGARLQT